jgi:hypothetical protein
LDRFEHRMTRDQLRTVKAYLSMGERSWIGSRALMLRHRFFRGRLRSAVADFFRYRIA